MPAVALHRLFLVSLELSHGFGNARFARSTFTAREQVCLLPMESQISGRKKEFLPEHTASTRPTSGSDKVEFPDVSEKPSPKPR
jgi:hypothetical protein